jgi:GntR family transcriptional regulator, transcriptional repressor for pyruvate dehydrogenase complex
MIYRMKSADNSKLNINRIEPKTVVEQVMERIKDLIASGRYKVNDRLPSQDELASMFDIGRNSIREAMKVFEYLGIVKTRTGRGTVLCDRDKINSEALTWSILLGNNDIFELLQLREVLEVKGLQALMDLFISDNVEFLEHLDNLNKIIVKMQDAVADGSLEDLIATDYDFHAAIISISKNTLFSEMFKTLKRFMNEESKQIDNRMDYRTACEQHVQILGAIKTGNRSEALRELQEHIQFVRESLAEIMQ